MLPVWQRAIQPHVAAGALAVVGVVQDQHADRVALFRLGVALRRRFESDARRPGDGQRAVAAWTDALAARPSQYIWRRRIQQYGPRLDKPYNMFGWVEQARKEIVARGGTPVTLAVEPRGSELIGRGPAPGAATVRGYALYYVCERAGGVCRYLRRDFSLTVAVDSKAPKIQ